MYTAETAFSINIVWLVGFSAFVLIFGLSGLLLRVSSMLGNPTGPRSYRKKLRDLEKSGVERRRKKRS